MVGYIPRWFIRSHTVTHASTNRARRKVTTLIDTNALPLSHATNIVPIHYTNRTLLRRYSLPSGRLTASLLPKFFSVRCGLFGIWESRCGCLQKAGCLVCSVFWCTALLEDLLCRHGVAFESGARYISMCHCQDVHEAVSSRTKWGTRQKTGGRDEDEAAGKSSRQCNKNPPDNVMTSITDNVTKLPTTDNVKHWVMNHFDQNWKKFHWIPISNRSIVRMSDWGEEVDG